MDQKRSFLSQLLRALATDRLVDQVFVKSKVGGRKLGGLDVGNLVGTGANVELVRLYQLQVEIAVLDD